MDRAYALSILEDRELFTRIVAFNGRYGRTLGYRADLYDKNFIEALKSADPALLLLQEHKAFEFEFTEGFERTLLVDDNELEFLCRRLGAAALAKMFANTILKEQKNLLFTFIDQELYDFVLKFARFILDESLILNKASFDEDLIRRYPNLGAAILGGFWQSLENVKLKEIAKNRLKVLMGDEKEARILNPNKLYRFIGKVLSHDKGKLWTRCLN